MYSTSRARPCLLTLLFLSGIAMASDMRAWTDQQGNQVRAAFSERIECGQAVRVRRADGTTIDIPFSRLSTEDRAYAIRRTARDLRRRPHGFAPSAFVYRTTTDHSVLYRVSRTIDTGRNVRIGFFASVPEPPRAGQSATFNIQVYSPPEGLSFRPRNARQAALTVHGEAHALGSPVFWGTTGHEWFSYTVEHDFFLRIAHANSVTLRIGRHDFALTHEQREGMRVLLDHMGLAGKGERNDAMPSPLSTGGAERKLPEGLVYRPSRFLDVGSNVEISFSASGENYEMHVSSYSPRARFSANKHAEIYMDGKILSRDARSAQKLGGRRETFERIRYSFTPDLFERMARARIVDVRVGDGAFTLTHAQRQAMRVLLQARKTHGREHMALPDSPGAHDSAVFVFGTAGEGLPKEHEPHTETMIAGDNVRVSFSAAERDRIAPFRMGSYFLTVFTVSDRARFSTRFSRKAEIEMDGLILDVRSPRAGNYEERRRVHEVMSFAFTPELFDRMARAQDVAVRVGPFAFDLPFAQRKRMREIAGALPP